MRPDSVRRQPGADDERKRDRRERALVWFLGCFTALTLVAWMFWSLTADRRAIARLPAEQRAVIFEHTMSGVRAMCSDPTDLTIQRRCREQAEFLLSFPECDADCEALVAPLLRRAPR